MKELSPLARQALMRFLPSALNAKDRNEFSQIIYDELEENIYFKKDILLFFLKKHNIDAFTMEIYDEDSVLSPPLVLNIEEVKLVANKGLLKELRNYELEIFGVGEDFVEANDEGIDAVNLNRIDTLFDLIVSHNLMSNNIPSEDEKEITSLEDETFYLPLRLIFNGKPCTFFIGDAKNFFMEQLNEIANNHLSLIMPYQKEESYYINEDDEEVKTSTLSFMKEEHSEDAYYKMCYQMIDKVNDLVDRHNRSIPDDFIHTEIFYKEKLDIFSNIVMIKNINVAKNIPVKKLLSTLNDNFTEYGRDFFDEPLSDMAGEIMDFLDLKLVELENEYKENKVLKEKGIALFADKKKKTTFIYDDIVVEEESEENDMDDESFMSVLDELYD
jgi:hypothetical protein